MKNVTNQRSITIVSGNNPKTSNDVTGFLLQHINLCEFPQNLSNIFPNLLALHIINAKLKEIRQSDIAPWTQLKYLNLDRNDIQSLEKDLFKLNRELEWIFISQNRIKYIEATVFDGFSKLSQLNLKLNDCIDNRKRNVTITRLLFFKTNFLEEMIKEVREKCGKESNKRSLSAETKIRQCETGTNTTRNVDDSEPLPQNRKYSGSRTVEHITEESIDYHTSYINYDD